jgi:general stress protein 26
MSNMTLADLSKKIADIDFAMLSTRTSNGAIAARPMSNNGDVEYDGDSFFFAFDSSHTVQDIQRDSSVGLTFTGAKGMLGKPPTFIAIEGHAEIIHDKAAFEQHWTHDIEHWAKNGADTPGLALIKVHAARIHYWDGEDQGELVV